MRQQKKENHLCPSLVASILYRCRFQISDTIGNLTFHFRTFANLQGFFVPMLFEILLFCRHCTMWRLKEPNKPIESNTENTIDRTSFGLFADTRTIISNNPMEAKTDDPSWFCSTSSRLVSNVNLKSSSVAALTSSLLLIHCFSSHQNSDRVYSGLITTIVNSFFRFF